MFSYKWLLEKNYFYSKQFILHELYPHYSVFNWLFSYYSRHIILIILLIKRLIFQQALRISSNILKDCCNFEFVLNLCYILLHLCFPIEFLFYFSKQSNIDLSLMFSIYFSLFRFSLCRCHKLLNSFFFIYRFNRKINLIFILFDCHEC